MEAYQPLNTYSFCQTDSRKLNQNNRTSQRSIIAVKSSKQLAFKSFMSIIFVLIIVVTTVFVKIDASEPISTVVAESEFQIVVGTGDSLWKIASAHYPLVKDTGFAVHMIKERNGLIETTIFPGQKIILPAID